MPTLQQDIKVKVDAIISGSPQLQAFSNTLKEIQTRGNSKVSFNTTAAQSSINNLTDLLRKVSPTADNVISKFEGLGQAAGLGLGSIAAPAALATAAIVSLGAAVTAAISGIFQLAKHAADLGGEIFDASQKVNFGAETLSALKAAGDDADVSFESLTTALAIFNKNIDAAAAGDKELSKTLKELQVDTTNNELALRQAFRSLQAMGSSAHQTALAMKLFGKSGKEVLGVIKETNGDIDESIKRYAEMGRVIDDQAALAADRFGDSLQQMQATASAAARSIGQEVLPTFTTFFEDVRLGLQQNATSWSSWGVAINRILTEVLGAMSGFVRGINALLGSIQQGLFLEALQVPFKLPRFVVEETQSLARRSKIDAALAESFLLGERGLTLARGGGEGFGGRRGGRGRERETETERSERVTEQFIDRLERELNLLTLENTAFFQRRNLFKQELVELELRTSAYDKLTEAQKELIREKAKEVEQQKRQNESARIFAEFLERESQATDKARGFIDQFSEAMKKLEADLARVGVVMDATQRQRAEFNLAMRLSAERVQRLNEELRRLAENLGNAILPQEGLASLERELEERGGNVLSPGDLEELGPPPELLPQFRSVFEQIGDALREIVGFEFENLGRTITDVITGVRSLGDAFRGFALAALAAIQQVIIKMLVLKAIQAAVGIFGGGAPSTASAGGGGGFPFIFGAATGGEFAARPGGHIIQIAEGGHDELVVTTDRRYQTKTASLLAQFIERTGILPAFAAGGMAFARPGGRLIQVAEGGHDELVLTTDRRHEKRTASLLGQFIERTGILPAFAAGGFTSETILNNISAHLPRFELGGFVGPDFSGALAGAENLTLVQNISFPGVRDHRGFVQNQQAIKRDLARAAVQGINRLRGVPR